MVFRSTVSPVLKIGLQMLGIWPCVSYSTVHWLSFMLITLIIQYFQYLYIFEHMKISELSNLIDCLTVTFDFSLALFKLIGLWIHRRIFHQLLVAMDNDWHECINNDQHLYLMIIKANISHLVCNAILSIIAVGSVVYLLGDYVNRFIFLNENDNITSRQLPIKIQLPFETQQSPIFEFLVITIFLLVLLHGFTRCTLNGLILTLVLHVSGQIDIMCYEFGRISNKSVFHHKSIVSLFGTLIERHNRIISFSEKIEELFSFIALMQVVWNTLVIGSLGFFMIISIHNETVIFVLIKTIVGYLGIMAEAFIICFAGEYLSLKGKLIANATYELLWYNMPLGQSKMLILVIMRSQKRLMITAGKMMDMSFDTFTNIIKASVSYISVMNAMY